MELYRKNLELIKNLNKIGTSLSDEKNICKVYNLILDTAMQYTNAEGGTLYTVKGRKLHFTVVKNQKLGLDLDDETKITWPDLSLYDEAGNEIFTSMVNYVYHKKKHLIVDDVYTQKKFDPSKTKEIDKLNNYRTKSSVIFPLINYEKEIIGIIQLINARDKNNNVISFTEDHRALFDSLGSQISILLSNRNLIKQLEEMIFSLMSSVANAIDKKSEWTGHHIRNVAVITEILVETINQAETGFFKDFKFSKNKIKEIKLAALIHDVGKIATPQHILDKKYKLDYENIRIDLIGTRFMRIINLLEKDIDIKKLKNKHYSDENNLIEMLSKDLKFIKDVNNQKIFIDNHAIERLEKIYDFEYKINNEKLFLINKIEFKNLSIRRGTLNNEEREIIKKHALITKEVLEKVPFPKRFAKLPFYAYTHHEKINGKGYPDHLKGKALPLQSRIIAFADIFEALTAHDRIYKKPNKISTSLKILANMVNEKSIDKNIMNLVLESRVYLDYAKKYLLESQIDEVDITKLKRIYE